MHSFTKGQIQYRHKFYFILVTRLFFYISQWVQNYEQKEQDKLNTHTSLISVINYLKKKKSTFQIALAQGLHPSKRMAGRSRGRKSVTKFSCLTEDSPHKANFLTHHTIFRFYQLQQGDPTGMSWGHFSEGPFDAKLNFLQVQVTKHEMESKLRYCLFKIVPEGIAQSP